MTQGPGEPGFARPLVVCAAQPGPGLLRLFGPVLEGHTFAAAVSPGHLSCSRRADARSAGRDTVTPRGG